MRSRQRGLAGALVAVVLVIAAVIALATLALSRQSTLGGRAAEVTARMQVLHDALTQFVAANGRLPCPTNPAADDGAEAVGGAPGTCTYGEGTVPWLTIGARRDDGIDPWSHKISYRVYTGAAGSLTQAGGASMVQCDTAETTPAAVTTVSGSSGGLCRSDVRVTLRDTTPANFLNGKGLTVDDLGTNRTDVAYVLVSHGPTGGGAYTTNGIRRDLPEATGSERANTTTTGPFVIKAFSEAGVDATTAAHFDDFVAYRRIEDLIRAAGVYARDWPEESTTATTFNRATVEGAVGTSVTSGSGVGQVSVSFTGVVASGVAGGAATEVAFMEAVDLSWSGIGVAGGGSALLQSSANELLRFQLERASKFAITLTNFGFYSGDVYEIVEFRFFNNGTEVGAPRYGVGCNIDGAGTLASFTMDVGVVFDRVDVTPYPAYDISAAAFSGITALLVTELKSCPAADATCVTSLAAPANNCPVF
jgi:type II secretory pathway pseudopilin PulG